MDQTSLCFDKTRLAWASNAVGLIFLGLQNPDTISHKYLSNDVVKYENFYTTLLFRAFVIAGLVMLTISAWQNKSSKYDFAFMVSSLALFVVSTGLDWYGVGKPNYQTYQTISKLLILLSIVMISLLGIGEGNDTWTSALGITGLLAFGYFITVYRKQLSEKILGKESGDNIFSLIGSLVLLLGLVWLAGKISLVSQ